MLDREIPVKLMPLEWYALQDAAGHILRSSEADSGQGVRCEYADGSIQFWILPDDIDLDCFPMTDRIDPRMYPSRS